MILDLSYWAWLGTIYLIILSYQDIKNNMNVDDRKNYFMFGATFALLSHIDRPLWIILLFFGIIIGLNYYMNKIKVLGEADNTTLIWIFYGFAIINPAFLAYFAGFFIIITLIYAWTKNNVYKVKTAPFYPVLLLTFILTNILFKLY